jgi:uncharacterized YigZ family protein
VDSYLTIRSGAEATGEVVDRRSRFIAALSHVSSEGEADAFLGLVRARHHDARHNVPAWVLADGRERCSDDGEPQHTAGMPTLEVLRASGLADACCVVTRYFGGTLLGPGGLVRAYTAATQAAVAHARDQGFLVEMCLVTRVVCHVPYASFDRATRLATDAGAHVVSTDFGVDVCVTLAFHSGSECAFVEAMGELMAGRDVCQVGTPAFAEF